MPKRKAEKKPAESLEDRIMRHVTLITESTCWYWTSALLPTGYSIVYYKGKSRIAHRDSYKIFVGEIPFGFEIDHLCRNRGCVNPKHLEAVSHKENMRRGESANRKKTHCSKGHEFSTENTYWSGPSKAVRLCKICCMENQRKRRKRRRNTIASAAS